MFKRTKKLTIIIILQIDIFHVNLFKGVIKNYIYISTILQKLFIIIKFSKKKIKCKTKNHYIQVLQFSDENNTVMHKREQPLMIVE